MTRLFNLSFVFPFCISTLFVAAQTNTSPYSIIGIGDIEQSNADRSSGMADAGVSLSSGRYIYNANPASYSALDNHYFSLELTARFKAVSYVGNAVPLDNKHSSDMQMGRLAAAIKIKNFWGASVGLLPYSSSNYSFYAQKNIEGTDASTLAHYDGTGGLYNFYIGNGFAITKHLSVGVQANVLFGSLLQNETLNTTVLADSVVTTTNKFLNKVVPKAGFQYKTGLSRNLKLNIGATASPSSDLNAQYTLDVTEGNTVLVENKLLSDSKFTLPLSYTGGLSVVYKEKLTLAADYGVQQWSRTSYTGLGYSLQNSNRFSAGIQYASIKKYGNLSYEDFYVQGGLYYGNNYLVINGNQLTDKGFTIGLGGTAKRSGLGYQMNLQVGSKGANSSAVLTENYTRISIGLFYRDFWFTKYKKYN